MATSDDDITSSGESGETESNEENPEEKQSLQAQLSYPGLLSLWRYTIAEIEALLVTGPIPKAYFEHFIETYNNMAQLEFWAQCSKTIDGVPVATVTLEEDDRLMYIAKMGVLQAFTDSVEFIGPGGASLDFRAGTCQTLLHLVVRGLGISE